MHSRLNFLWGHIELQQFVRQNVSIRFSFWHVESLLLSSNDRWLEETFRQLSPQVIVHAACRSQSIATPPRFYCLSLSYAAVLGIRLIRRSNFDLFWCLALVSVEIDLRHNVASQLSLRRAWMHFAVEGELEHGLVICLEFSSSMCLLWLDCLRLVQLDVPA